MNDQSNAKMAWERPELVRMDAADAKAGTSHHADAAFFRRTVHS